MPWTDDDLSAALAGLRDEPLPADALARVRAAVMTRVERPKRRWWWWLAPVPAAVAFALLLPRPAEIPPPPLLARAPAPAPFMHPRPVQIRRSRPPRFAPTAQDGLVRLASTRNDIVIYWDLTAQGETK
jgi:hypothetical protein